MRWPRSEEEDQAAMLQQRVEDNRRRRAKYDAMLANDAADSNATARVADFRQRIATLSNQPWYKDVVISISCKATMCKIDIDYPSQQLEDEAAESILGKKGVLGKGFTHLAYLGLVPGENRATAYRWHVGRPNP
jgi:hypothetical protein